MTIEEKRKAVIEYCHSRKKCDDCVFNTGEEQLICVKVNFNYAPDAVIDDCYNIVFGGEKEEFTSCCDCQFYECDEEDFPCNDCTHNHGNVEHFEMINSGTTPEEINHPDRYAGGKFECIDVMLDVFGADAVKHFCILNAFKYLWRAEKKNGVEDIKKAVWYLNKFIELGGDE